MFRSEHEMRQAGTWDESVQTITDTICPYCGVGCTLSLHVQVRPKGVREDRPPG